jgi:transglutaminase-like putative cysteine protease
LRYRDYWGTEVTAFDIHSPHRELAVTATSVVETALRQGVSAHLGWDDLRRPEATDRFAEWLGETPRTDPDDGLLAAARAHAGDLPPGPAAVACVEAVHGSMDYRTGATGVHTNGREAWQAKVGVCQDFAHVSLSMLRALGIPARYVSGYLHPNPEAAIGETVAGESHAWVEWWDGDWIGYDPTNGRPVGEQHVLVARGRDYDDVTPLKGVYSGPRASELGVVVEVTRLA